MNNMLKYTLSVLCMVLAIGVLCNEAGSSQWSKTFNNIDDGVDRDEYPYSIKQTVDGGYVIYGQLEYGLFLTKLDGDGAVIWQKRYFDSSIPPAPVLSQGGSVYPTVDGGYVMGGSYGSSILLVRVDNRGNIVWARAYKSEGQEVPGDNKLTSLYLTADGGCIINGRISDVNMDAAEWPLLLFKIDSEGNIAWRKKASFYHSTNPLIHLYEIVDIADGNYIATGSVRVDTLMEMLVMKLDQNGTILWNKRYEETVGGLYSRIGYGRSVTQTPDGGYIVAGATEYSMNEDIWLLKLDSNGNVGTGYPGTWQKSIGRFDRDYAVSVQKTIDGGYIVGGNTKFLSNSAMYNMWLIKLAADGAVQWQKSSNRTSFDTELESLDQTIEGGYSLAMRYDGSGLETNDVWTLKLDHDGNIPYASFMIDTMATMMDTASFPNAAFTLTYDADPLINMITPTLIAQDTPPPQETSQALHSDWYPVDSHTINNLNGVWGYKANVTSPVIFYAVGDVGTIVRYNSATDSCEASDSHTEKDLLGIWGSSESDIFAVGEGGIIIKYSSGSGWSIKRDYNAANPDLNEVWGSSINAVYAVGNGGTILHSTDQFTNYSTQSSGTTANLYGIWGSAANDIYAVGANGTILHSTGGGSWSPLSSGTLVDLNGVWGSTALDVYVVGDNGTLLHSIDQGSTWASFTLGTSSDFNFIWGSSASNIYIAGDDGIVFHYDGETWTAQDAGTATNLNSVFGVNNPHVFVVGDSGTIVQSQGPEVEGMVIDVYTGFPASGVTVKFDPQLPGSDIYTKYTNANGYHAPSPIGGGFHFIRFSHADYSMIENTLTLPAAKSMISLRTLLQPTTLLNGQPKWKYCIAGTVSGYVNIGGTLYNHGLKGGTIELGQGCSPPVQVTTDENGFFRFTSATPYSGDYTIKLDSRCSGAVDAAGNPVTMYAITLPGAQPKLYDFIGTMCGQ